MSKKLRKRIAEQKAIINVAAKIKQAGGDAGDEAVKNFLASGATDDILQYEKALEDNAELAGTLQQLLLELQVTVKLMFLSLILKPKSKRRFKHLPVANLRMTSRILTILQ